MGRYNASILWRFVFHGVCAYSYRHRGIIFVRCGLSPWRKIARSGRIGPAPTGKQQAAPPKQPTHVPDMVCFGNNPRWSFQFGDTAARTLGISEGDKYWIGKFMYVDGQWSWHGNPATGSGGGLTATITKGKCIENTACRHQGVSVPGAGLSAGRRHREWLLPQAEAGRSAGGSARVHSRIRRPPQ